MFANMRGEHLPVAYRSPDQRAVRRAQRGYGEVLDADARDIFEPRVQSPDCGSRIERGFTRSCRPARFDEEGRSGSSRLDSPLGKRLDSGSTDQPGDGQGVQR